MAKIRVNEEKRTVRAYNEDLQSEEDFKEVERYTRLGYKVILIPARQKAYKHIKNDMIKYLEGNIADEIYIEFIDRVEKQQNFLKLKWWLVDALKKQAEKDKKLYEPYEDIINRAKSKENGVIDKAKEQAKIDNEKKNKAKEKENKVNENENK